MTDHTTPVPLALMVADEIWTDPTTGKRTVLGTFSGLLSTQFPAIHGRMAFYLAITDGRSTGSVDFRIVDINDETEPVLAVSCPVELNNPLVVAEIIAKVENVAFPRPGMYVLQALWNGVTPIIERRLPVVERTPQEGTQ